MEFLKRIKKYPVASSPNSGKSILLSPKLSQTSLQKKLSGMYLQTPLEENSATGSNEPVKSSLPEISQNNLK